MKEWFIHFFFAGKRVIKILNMLKAIFRLITVAAPTRTVFLILHSLEKGMANHVTYEIILWLYDVFYFGA